MKREFSGRVLILGCGAVSQCFQHLFARHIGISYDRVTLIDPQPPHELLELLKRGAHYLQERITSANFKQIFSQYVSQGDIIIDLAVDISTIDTIDWCQKNDVMYINTAVELWPEELEQALKSLQKTLYERHSTISKKRKEWHGSTAVVEHGANPGLVSHWTKQALREIAHELLSTHTSSHTKKIEQALVNNNFPELAQMLGVRIIHISERDTQLTNKPKKVNEFVNTWSVIGLHEEAIAPAEIGWGTHEVAKAGHHTLYFNEHKTYVHLDSMGMHTWAHSWIPAGHIIGMIVRHGEVLSISNYLSVWNNNHTLAYRPTVHYVYLPSDSTCASLHELSMNDYILQHNKRILTDEIIGGSDELGVLLLGHELNGWWTGSSLSIEQTREIAPHQNATTMQVAASVLGALFWMIKNPRKGFCFPDDLPYDEILTVAEPYLGTLISQRTDWAPYDKKHTKELNFNDFLVRYSVF